MKSLIFGTLFSGILSASYAQANVVRGSLTAFRPVTVVATVPTAASYDVHIVTSQFTIAPGQYNLLIDDSSPGVLNLTVTDQADNYRKIAIAVPRTRIRNPNLLAGVRLTANEIAQNFDVSFATRQISVNTSPQVRGVVCDKHAKRGYRYWKTQTVARVGTQTETQMRLLRPGSNEVIAVIRQQNDEGVRDQILNETKCVMYDGRPDAEPKSFDWMGFVMKSSH